jgi:hypothetical protein
VTDVTKKQAAKGGIKSKSTGFVRWFSVARVTTGLEDAKPAYAQNKDVNFRT